MTELMGERGIWMVTPPHLRSALFVPADRLDRLIKSLQLPADALIVDLEDSVSTSVKDQARQHVHALTQARQARQADAPQLCVRINALARRCLADDLQAAVSPALLAVLVPKVDSVTEIEAVDAALSRIEAERGIAVGSVHIWPLIESARAVLAAADIAAASPRIAYMGGGTARGGDLAASIGFEYSPDGWETLYLRSKILIDVRAAGVPHPMTGVATDIDDLAAVRLFARRSRSLGYEGTMVIHPSHLAVANEVFGVSAEERSSARATLDALQKAEQANLGAVTHDGRMLDAAMRASAEDTLTRRSAWPPSTDLS
jgi:citrate lyase subunit beta/citryl-CoA lyase